MGTHENPVELYSSGKEWVAAAHKHRAGSQKHTVE
jgi:hypothetical protein